MRTKKLKYNTITSLLYQIIAIICGFIVPRMIIGAYGSDVNGLISSINEFLGVITLMEMGIGTVVQSALYGPLSINDKLEVSKIVVAARKFFRKVAIVFLVYIVGLLFTYPKFINSNYNSIFTGVLIIAISINYFIQYYFGIVDRLLLIADQRGYIFYFVNSVTLILNTIGSIILILLGFQIHYVKFLAALIYIIRPFVIRIYVNRHYSINRKIEYIGEPIKQKWNGFMQHIASFVLDGTDTIVLSVFSTLENVSIYAVYYLVIKGVRELFISLTSGIQALLGELWAKKEYNELIVFFKRMEWIIHSGVVFIFGTTACLIVSFIGIYTKGINDANYIQPLFAYILTLANAFRCIRLPYNLMIFAAGRFKESQKNFLIAVCINLSVSIITVIKWGLIGVALGTLLAMIYQTCWMAWYSSQNLHKIPFHTYLKQIMVDVITVITASLIVYLIKDSSILNSYFDWIIEAVWTCLIWILCIVFINFVFYQKQTVEISKYLKRKISENKYQK